MIFTLLLHVDDILAIVDQEEAKWIKAAIRRGSIRGRRQAIIPRDENIHQKQRHHGRYEFLRGANI
jgi:hypothetical protein